MKIATYNIKSGGFNNYFSKSDLPEKLDLIKAAIKKIDADFIALIDTCRWESTFTNDDLKRIFNYKGAYTINIEDKTLLISVGITVLTNLPVISFESVRIFDRNCLKAVVKVGERELNTFSLYLDYRKEQTRESETLSLLNQVQNKNTLIIGDFNSLRSEDVIYSEKIYNKILRLIPFLKLIKVFQGLFDSVEDMFGSQKIVDLLKGNGFTEAEGRVKFEPTMPTKIYFPLIPPIFRVDYFFHSPDLLVENYKVIRGKLFDKTSDHYPISCEVTYLD